MGFTRTGKPTKNDGQIHHAIHGQINYFNGHFPKLCKRLPEGIDRYAEVSGSMGIPKTDGL